MNVSRRSFLKASSATAAVVLSNGITKPIRAASSVEFKPGPGNKWPGRVAINYNKKAVSDSGKVDADVVKKMVDDLILLLTDQEDVGQAWKKVFPDTLTLQSKIAIKINTANTGKPGPHWASVRAITEGLKKMIIDGAPFPANNITLYDMDFQGSLHSAGYTNTNFPDITIEYSKLVDGGDGALNNRGYASVLKEADFLINIFSPRGHTYPPEGSRFTLGFKSHVGTYAETYKAGGGKGGPELHNPPGSGGMQDDGLYGPLVENLREMNCTGPVFKKTVLSFCSGLFGMNEGNGPGGSADTFEDYVKSVDVSAGSADMAPCTFMFSTDPVAIEMQAVKLMRLNNGGGYNVEDMPPYLLTSAGIASDKIGGAVYNIGIINEEEMDIRRIINDVTSIERPLVSRVRLRNAGIAVSPIRGRNITFIEFRASGLRTGYAVNVEITTLNGAVVYKRSLPVRGVLNRFSWNNRRLDGRPVGKGTYVVRITSIDFNLVKQFAVLH